MSYYSYSSSRAQLFVGRLDKDVRTKDLEDIFSRYGKLLRCDIKYGAALNYAFVDYEDRRDGEDAIKYENGRDLRGQAICVEWAKGPNYRYDPRKDPSRYDGHRSSRDGGGGGGGGFRRRHSRSRSRSDSRSRRRSRSGSRSRRRRSKSRSGSRDKSRSRSKSH